MNKMLNILCLLFIFFLSGLSYGQSDSENIIRQIEAYYKESESYGIKLNYKLFRGHKGNNMTESYNGTFIKEGNNMMLDIMNIKVVQYKDLRITIDNDNEMIWYSDKEIGDIENLPMLVSSMMKFYDEVSRSEKGNFTEIKFKLKSTDVPIPYSQMVFLFDNETYKIKEQIFYFSTKLDFPSDAGSVQDLARLQINYEDINGGKIKEIPVKETFIKSFKPVVVLGERFAKYKVEEKTDI